MSRVYFDTEHAQAELRGSERAWAGGLVSDLATGLLPRWQLDERVLNRLVNPRHDWTAIREPGWAIRVGESLRLTLSVEAESLTFEIDGELINGWQLQLNTAVLLGNDTVRLLTRLYAQCEIHGWIPEQHREWYAGLVDAGRAAKILRPDEGWEDVAALCRNGDGGPVVTSYSVTDEFPDPHSADWPLDDDDSYDSWYELPAKERWAMAVAKLPDDRVWAPDGWATPYFGTGATMLDLTR